MVCELLEEEEREKEEGGGGGRVQGGGVDEEGRWPPAQGPCLELAESPSICLSFLCPKTQKKKKNELTFESHLFKMCKSTNNKYSL